MEAKNLDQSFQKINEYLCWFSVKWKNDNRVIVH